MGRTFTRPCPHCSQPVTWPDMPTFPFCSERCRLIDLGLWASGEYRIPSASLADEEAWPESLAPEQEDEPWC